MKNLLRSLSFVSLLFSFLHSSSQTTLHVSSAAELTSAVTNAVDGDIISFNTDIVITATINNSKSISFNGNGFTLQVPVTGLDEAGRFNASASTFRVFNLTGSGKTTILNKLNIKGGHFTGSGGAISVSSGHILRITDCILSQSSASQSGGGLGNSGGVVYITGSKIIRNASGYGGGFFNDVGGTMYFEHSTISENRSTVSGGGACENKGAGTRLFVNNSTFSNNQSVEIGGGINNYGATVYVTNSSFTGNVAYGGYGGGAIGNNGGYVYAINSLFAYNYRRTGGDPANPTAFSLDDLVAFSSPDRIYLYYNILHSTLLTGTNQVIGNVAYTGLADGSNNTIFSGGALKNITNGDGFSIGTAQVYQPFLYDNGGIAPTLQPGSFTLNPANRGSFAGYDNNNNISPVVGYYNRTTSTWVALLGSNPSSHQIMIDQTGAPRNNPPAIGAIESEIGDLYMVKVTASTRGTVSGASIYGDVYPTGTAVSLTAMPNASSRFLRWDYVLGGTGTASTSNPYNFTVTQDVTLTPVFDDTPGGTFNITYVGNGNTDGTPPAGGNFAGGTTLQPSGTLQKTGYIFTGWNTNAIGTGTNYSAGTSYNGPSVILYAKWSDNFWRGGASTDFNLASNWGGDVIPAIGRDVVIANNAVRDLILQESKTIGKLQFSSANVKVVLGDYDLSATSVTDAGIASYVQTNGTGKLNITVDNATSIAFPVGNAGYNPLTITNNTGIADNFSVAVKDEVYQNGNDGVPVTVNRIARTWDINKDNANGGSGVTLAFEWDASANTGLTTPSLYHYSGSWSELNHANGAAPTATSFIYSGYTGTFSPFSILEANSILPLDWVGFDVKAHNNTALLQWQTMNEFNTMDFVIQQSNNGSDWQNVGNIKAKQSVSLNTYSFVHSTPTSGTNYYRLIQRDLDGKYSFSGVRILSIKASEKIILPLGNVVKTNAIEVLVGETTELSILSVDGKLIWRNRVSQGRHNIQLNVANGMYFLKSPKEVVRFIKVQ